MNDLDQRIVIRYLLPDRWRAITTRFGKTCPENVVSGNSGLSYELFGTYGRTSSNSNNKIISYVNSHRSWSVCQKPRLGIYIPIYMFINPYCHYYYTLNDIFEW